MFGRWPRDVSILSMSLGRNRRRWPSVNFKPRTFIAGNKGQLRSACASLIFTRLYSEKQEPYKVSFFKTWDVVCRSWCWISASIIFQSSVCSLSRDQLDGRKIAAKFPIRATKSSCLLTHSKFSSKIEMADVSVMLSGGCSLFRCSVGRKLAVNRLNFKIIWSVSDFDLT